MEPEKDEHFEIELFEPSGGAKIGNINRIAITITNDDGKNFNNINVSILKDKFLESKYILLFFFLSFQHRCGSSYGFNKDKY